MSSTEVDDTDPRFDYEDNAWTAGGQSGEFHSTSHSTSMAGAQVVFGPFTGSSITVFSTVGTSQPKIHFLVDDDIQNADLPARSNSEVQFQQQLYSAVNLDPTVQHKLQINVLDAGPFTLDYVLLGNGQSGIVMQQSSSVSTSNVSSSHATGTLGVSTSSDASPTTSATQGVGGSVTSSSISSLHHTTSSSASSTNPSPSLNPSSASPPPLAAGADPTLSVSSDSTAVGSATSISASSSATSIPMGAASTSGLDATVIGSVAGSIVFLAIVVVSVVLFLRRRRIAQPGRSVPNNKPPGWHDSQPIRRPSLRLSIPSSLSITRNLQRPSLLPTHSMKSVPTSINHSASFGTSGPMPSFLAEDPNDSPVFDIKQRPASGSTMTTRVTVGTTIGQRVSVPESLYHYSYPETPVAVPVPPLPVLPTKNVDPSPTETGSSSATGSHMGFGLLGTNPAGTLDTSIFPGFTENGSATAGSGVSASRPLPYTPTDAKRAQVGSERSDRAAPAQGYANSYRFLPTTPSEVEAVIHRDGGVRLASNARGQPRRELPPPYQDYGF